MSMTDSTQKNQQSVIGLVISDRMAKSVVVEIETKIKHKAYHKFVTRKKKLVANVDGVSCKVGDKVALIQIRPVSKTKKWQVQQVIN